MTSPGPGGYVVPERHLAPAPPASVDPEALMRPDRGRERERRDAGGVQGVGRGGASNRQAGRGIRERWAEERGAATRLRHVAAG